MFIVHLGCTSLCFLMRLIYLKKNVTSLWKSKLVVMGYTLVK
jgi:hypothetical protein